MYPRPNRPFTRRRARQKAWIPIPLALFNKDTFFTAALEEDTATSGMFRKLQEEHSFVAGANPICLWNFTWEHNAGKRDWPRKRPRRGVRLTCFA